MLFLNFLGINIFFWSVVGLIRYLGERLFKGGTAKITNSRFQKVKPYQVAALVPAHNEELSIAATLNSLKKILANKNIYVASDGSKDRTIEIVKNLNCNVVDIRPNRGKAGALVYAIEHFKLLSRYEAILFVDSDTEIDESYLKNALPLFNDRQVMAVAGHVVSKWQKHFPPRWSMFFIAHRVRLYRFLQAALRYGQTWKFTNVNYIVPGFASIYRTKALREMKIDAPGLIIEDYNMTFELHHKRLGKIAYSPKATAVTQDPVGLFDYVKQVKRWNLGFWQTVRRHGVWFSFFWLALGIFIVEISLFGFLVLFLPFLFEWFFLTSFTPFPIPFVDFLLDIQISCLGLVTFVFVADYLITILVAIIEKKPMLLFYGLGFIFLRFVDTYLFFITLPTAFLTKSEGKWVSPKRYSN